MSARRSNKGCNCPRGVYCKGSEGRCAPPFRISVPAYTGAKKQVFYGPFKSVEEAVAFRHACCEANRQDLPHPRRDTTRAGIGGGRLSVEEAFDVWMDGRRGQLGAHTWNTERLRCQKIVQFCEDHDLRTPSHIRRSDLGELARWLQTQPQHRGRPYGLKTAKGTVWLARAMLRNEYTSGRIDRDVGAAPVKVRRVQLGIEEETAPEKRLPDRALTFTECHRIAQNLHPSWRAALWLGQIAGLRLGEIHGLRVVDFDGEGGQLRVAGQGGSGRHVWRKNEDGELVVDYVPSDTRVARTKTPAGTRTIGLPPVLVEFLMDYIRRHHHDPPDPDAQLVRNPDGNPGRTKAFALAYERARDAVGLSPEDIGFRSTPHHLRKSVSSILQARAIPGSLISEYLGHEINEGADRVARVTADHYRLTVDGAAVIIPETLDKLVRDELGDLTVVDRNDLITIGQAAKQLDRDVRTVRRYVREGRLEMVVNPLAPVQSRSKWFRPEDVASLRDRRDGPPTSSGEK